METAAGRGDGSFSQQCSSCDDSSARCWCVDCNEALCDACVSAHRRVSVTRSHKILNQPAAGSVSTPPIKFCRLHPAEPLKLFCFTCNQLTCRDCQLMGHMNHRYQFVREALDSMKKQLEVQVQPIRMKRDTARQSLQDMETRLQDITDVESKLKSDLQNSYSIICEQLKRRMDVLMDTAKTVCTKEAEKIQRKIQRLKKLQQNQEWVTETAEKSRNTNDLLALLRYKAQIESELKNLADQNLSPPLLMPQLNIVTDNSFLQIVLKFGELDVSWVPFSVDRDTTSAAAASCGLRPQTSSTINIDSPGPPGPPGPLNSSSSSPLCLPPSILNINQSGAPLTTPTAATSTPAVQHLSSSPVVTVSLPGSDQTQVQPKNPVQSVCPSRNLQPVTFCLPPQPSNITILEFLKRPLVLNQPAAPQQTHPPVLLPNSQQVHQVLPMMLSKAPSYTAQQKKNGSRQLLPAAAAASNITPPTSTYSASSSKPLPQTRTTNDLSSSRQLCLPLSYSSAVTLPTSTYRPLPHPDIPSAVPENHLTTCQTASDPTPLGQTATDSDLQPLKDQIETPSGPLSLLQCLTSDVTLGSSSQSPVVRAVADSACDLSVQQVTARQPAENEPTSTMCEETEPAAKPAELSDREEPSSVIGHTHGSLSQSQPRASLVSLPVSPPRPGSLVPGGEEDELHLEEMREDSQSRVDDVTDDVTELPSSPESPVTLQIVSCSACGSSYGSIMCSACGRGYHRGCHVPPVGPDIRSVWICSLCQDLSDPSDPYSSDTPQRPPGPGLSLLDQRKCESLLLCVKVDGCSQLSESGSVRSDLELISERLTLHRSPSYQTAAEFVSDIWRLFKDMKGDVLTRLQESLSPELHLLVLTAASSRDSDGVDTRGSKVKSQDQDVITSESKLTEMRNRLRELLHLKHPDQRGQKRRTDLVLPQDHMVKQLRVRPPVTSQQPIKSLRALPPVDD
ncbi:uncharacterized protein trim33l [Pagrus major]|uniref:uncharacterized protein trim33l n=1 Tax=Pagrus major TaxID=143350 RepID=UPI003CC8A670